MRSCVKCGADVVPKCEPDRRYRYKTLVLKIGQEVIIETCSGCGAQYIGEKEAKAIDEVLQPKYEQELQQRASRLIEGLMTQYRQWQLELLLGLSHGYLSKVLHGERIPSAALVAVLALLAANNEGIQTLASFWQTDETGWASCAEPDCDNCAKNVGAGCIAMQQYPADAGYGEEHCDGYVRRES